jgi:hypothetical protein
MDIRREEKRNVVEEIVDGLQNVLEDEGMNTEKLIQYLAQIYPANFPVENCKLSVVYWDHTAAQYRVLMEDGKPKDRLYLKNPNLPSDAVESNLPDSAVESIKEVIHNKPSVLASTKEQCQEYGFFECSSLIIVPMRVDFTNKTRIIGAFILQVEGRNPFGLSDQLLMDKLSDRLAVFIRFVDQKIRSEIIESFFNHTIDKKESYKNAAEILETTVCHLTQDGWFAPEEINIVLSHPFDHSQLYLACKDGVVADNLRKNGKTTDELTDLLGDPQYNLSESQEIVIFNTPEEISSFQLPAGFHSYILVPMSIHDKRIGYFILRNAHQNYAYKDEYNLPCLSACYTRFSQVVICKKVRMIIPLGIV